MLSIGINLANSTTIGLSNYAVQVGDRIDITSLTADAAKRATAYAWLRQTTVISGATQPFYIVQSADAGQEITGRVTLEDGTVLLTPAATVAGVVAPPAGNPVHILIVAGQSGASGRAVDDFVDAWPAGVLEWSANDGWEPVGSRLFQGPWEAGRSIAVGDAGTANFGWARSFAAAYAAANPGVTLLMVGVADGGKGFVNNDWNKGNPSYDQAVARCNAAIAAAPAGATVEGILWHQGENDAQSPAGRTAFKGAFDQFIADFRADIPGTSATTPFVTGGHFPGTSYYQDAIQTVHQSLPNRIPYTGYADPSSPTEALTFDGVHLNAASNRNFGPQYFKALTTAKANTTLGGGGAITLGTMVGASMTASASSGSVAGVAIGAAAADRLVLIGIGYRSTFQVTPESVQIGGIDAVRVVNAKGAGSICDTAIYYALVPAGTTADVDVVFDGTVVRSGIVVLPVYGARPHLASNTGYGKATGGAGYGTSIATNVDVAAGDLVFGVSSALFPGGTTGAISLGATTRVILSGTNQSIYAAAAVQGSAATGQAITNTFGGSVNFPSISALVLKPA